MSDADGNSQNKAPVSQQRQAGENGSYGGDLPAGVLLVFGTNRNIQKSEKFNRMMSGWNFRELTSFIGYKAALAGVPVIYVDPKETSKTCPRCGNVSRCNRKTQSWFKCTRCGYQSDADRVGALNIAAKALDALGA